jgi:hypothetical protein
MSDSAVLRRGLCWEANGIPLHERVPTVDEFGRPLSDFLMLLPGLRELGGTPFRHKVAVIEEVLRQFREVVFVDLNVPLNLLWVSVQARPGVILDIATTMKFHLPEALLVGHK